VFDRPERALFTGLFNDAFRVVTVKKRPRFDLTFPQQRRNKDFFKNNNNDDLKSSFEKDRRHGKRTLGSVVLPFRCGVFWRRRRKGRGENERTTGFGEVFDDSEFDCIVVVIFWRRRWWKYCHENERERRFESGAERCERNRRTNPEEKRRVVVRASEFRV
jgi:hypothetical protein